METGDSYTASGIAAYVTQLEWENRKLKEELSEIKNKTLSVDKFYGAKLDVKTVALLHNVSEQTVRAYVNEGIIPKHPDSTDRRYYISGAIALSLDFKELRRQLHG